MYADGNLLVSGSYDGTIRTWNIAVFCYLSRLDSLKLYIRRMVLSIVYVREKKRTSMQLLIETLFITLTEEQIK